MKRDLYLNCVRKSMGLVGKETWRRHSLVGQENKDQNGTHVSSATNLTKT